MAGDCFSDVFANQIAERVACVGESWLAALVEKQGPVTCFMYALPIEQYAMRCRQPAHITEYRAWCRDHVKVQVVENRLRIKFVAAPRNTVGTVGESQRLAVGAITQRLDREPVNGQENASARAIDNHQSVGSSDACDHFHPDLAPGLQKFCRKFCPSRGADAAPLSERRGTHYRAKGIGVAGNLFAPQGQRADQRRSCAGVEEAGQINLAREDVCHGVCVAAVGGTRIKPLIGADVGEFNATPKRRVVLCQNSLGRYISPRPAQQLDTHLCLR
ncbi:MAG: hypothetical protein CAPSK01_003045 [Candidatus Accumulibacter vicinus]|uniref:Uncharacterized protein n=1 Tax=Candidatus Accumulibacter vicinus TaxID=2954382 RepID=A0A084XYQ8_9PROT|nr:MAG: hypothetical protein CAPSK01_003045 [Candidatus Accumulibacter vicinus]